MRARADVAAGSLHDLDGVLRGLDAILPCSPFRPHFTERDPDRVEKARYHADKLEVLAIEPVQT